MGLDPDIDKVSIQKGESAASSFLTFNQRVIDNTHDLAVAYKLNTAFYEALGADGWNVMADTIQYIRSKDESILIITDAKRGDIGNTCYQYACAFFDSLGADAITLSPYMGRDSVAPFLEWKSKWSIILAITSNPSAVDFELQTTEDNTPLYQHVVHTSRTWGDINNTMYVVGATKIEALKEVRKIVPQHFLLVPGVGTQGGSLEEVCMHGLNKDKSGLLINASRSIIYAGTAHDIRKEAKELVGKMRVFP